MQRDKTRRYFFLLSGGILAAGVIWLWSKAPGLVSGVGGWAACLYLLLCYVRFTDLLLDEGARPTFSTLALLKAATAFGVLFAAGRILDGLYLAALWSTTPLLFGLLHVDSYDGDRTRRLMFWVAALTVVLFAGINFLLPLFVHLTWDDLRGPTGVLLYWIGLATFFASMVAIRDWDAYALNLTTVSAGAIVTFVTAFFLGWLVSRVWPLLTRLVRALDHFLLRRTSGLADEGA